MATTQTLPATLKPGALDPTLLAAFEEAARQKFEAALSAFREHTAASSKAPEAFFFVSFQGETESTTFKATESLKEDLAYYPTEDEEK